MAGDEVLAAALLDRRLHRSHLLAIEGRSHRLVRRSPHPRGHPRKRQRVSGSAAGRATRAISEVAARPGSLVSIRNPSRPPPARSALRDTDRKTRSRLNPQI
ncbi:MAG: ATP-binding protein [Pseudomonadota bacterium]